jgi:hypothetical protein
MGYALLIGDTLVSAEELSEKLALGTIGRFQAEAEKNPDAALQLSRGTVTASEVFAARDLEAPEFTPIGLGKPLSIEMLTVYTGDAPGRGLFGGQPDLLMTSAVRSVETFDAAPRAINQIVPDITDQQYIGPSALAEGCPIVYYKKSVENSTILCSFELITESFSDQVLQQMSALFKSAGSLPVFAPANAYLMAGSFLTKILAQLGTALVQNQPFLHANLDLRFDTPAVPPALARQAILYNDRDGAELLGYKVGLVQVGPDRQRVALQNEETGEVYQGNAPYIIVSLDGRNRDVELGDWERKLASAAVIERFYGAVDPGGQVVAAVEQAMDLYNDFMYHQKAKQIKEQLAELNPESETYEEEKQALETLLKAYAGNIRHELFKVAAPDT